MGAKSTISSVVYYIFCERKVEDSMIKINMLKDFDAYMKSVGMLEDIKLLNGS